MSELNAAQNPTFYRVRIKHGHNAIGLLVSAAGKRCIPSTQFWLTSVHVPPIASRTMPRYAYRYGLGIWVSRRC